MLHQSYPLILPRPKVSTAVVAMLSMLTRQRFCSYTIPRTAKMSDQVKSMIG